MVESDGIADTAIATLLARIPELEWQINKQKTFISRHALPKGLFSQSEHAAPINYVNEIKNNIHLLSKHTNERIRFYLAEKIQQQINVLVGLCSKVPAQSFPRSTSFSIDKISTRGQWLVELEKKIDGLMEQKKALINTLEVQKVQQASMSILLGLQQELGLLEKELTLLQEKLK